MASVIWHIQLLGGLTARQGEREVRHFETRKTAALLACLALHLEGPIPRELLAEHIWPDEDFDATRARLRQALSALRRDLEPDGTREGSILLADRYEIRLDPRVVTTDVHQFVQTVHAASQASSPAEAAVALRGAVDLYGGELLPGFYEDCFSTPRRHLAEVHQSALGQLASALAEMGDLANAVEVARNAVAADPLREDAHCDLMRLYAAAGRTAEALRQYHELERLLREELAATPSAVTTALLEDLRTGVARPHVASTADNGPTSPSFAAGPATDRSGSRSSTREGARLQLEPEGGAVPLGSRFYLARPTDTAFEAAIARGDSIVLVKGPSRTGKTSLLARGLQQARGAGARVVLTDMQKLIGPQLESADVLFRTLGEDLIDQLGLETVLGAIWSPGRGWNVNFERLMRKEVLASAKTQIVWALDEVDHLFSHPFASEVFGLFRSWHNERSLNPDGPWGRLTLAIAYATEAHLFIADLNQSPFNVGTRLVLDDFTKGEVAEMSRRYGSPLRDDAEVTRFQRLVGGNPYLVRRGLHAMVEEGIDIARLESGADSDEGPFGDHLRRTLSRLHQDAGLCDAMRAVLRGQPCPTIESFYRLRSAGLVSGLSPEHAGPRCALYLHYLQRHLT